MTINLEYKEYDDLWKFKMRADVIVAELMKYPKAYTLPDILSFIGYEEEAKALKEMA